MEEVRDKVYEWSLELINEGKILQGLILMLSTWNFNRFRRYMTQFKLDEFEEALKECDFSYFKDKTFEIIDFDSPAVKERVIDIYQRLSIFKGVEFTGASKVMHFMSPNMFVMWDTEIRKRCDNKPFGTSAEEYLRFNKKMQEKFKNEEFTDLDRNVTVARAIDLYNMEKYSNSKLYKKSV